MLAAARADEKSAPYFQVIGKNNDDSSGESLPLKSSSAKVSIDGTIARVRLTQRYANSGSVPIEAIYVFPASTRAAVHGMTLTTGGRVIAARIKESAKAKAEYETAKAEKKTAALLEEHRPNVFQMSVANLLPGDDIDVEIDWTETIPAVDSTYEFVFPDGGRPALHRRLGGGERGDLDGESPSDTRHAEPRDLHAECLANHHAAAGGSDLPEPSGEGRFQGEGPGVGENRHASPARMRPTGISSSAGSSATIRWTPGCCCIAARRRIISCSRSPRRRAWAWIRFRRATM